MKEIGNYIVEKLRINKETDLSRNLESVIAEIDDAFVKSKISNNDGEIHYKKHDSEGLGVYYTIFFNKREKKSSNDFGPLLAMEFEFKGNSKENLIEVYGKLSYSNGKHSYSVYSNVNKTYKYEFNFDTITSHTLFKDSFGGHNYYECSIEVVEALVNGITQLKYYADDYNAAMKKSRFTQQAWDKLVDLTKEIFNIK